MFLMARIASSDTAEATEPASMRVSPFIRMLVVLYPFITEPLHPRISIFICTPFLFLLNACDSGNIVYHR